VLCCKLQAKLHLSGELLSNKRRRRLNADLLMLVATRRHVY
jgi:hypothetical protein